MPEIRRIEKDLDSPAVFLSESEKPEARSLDLCRNVGVGFGQPCPAREIALC